MSIGKADHAPDTRYHNNFSLYKNHRLSHTLAYEKIITACNFMCIDILIFRTTRIGFGP